MINYYILLKCTQNGIERLKKMLFKLMTETFEVRKISDEVFLLVLKDGKDLAIFKASFSALTLDEASLFSALEIPSDSTIFYPYLDDVKKGEILPLFKVAKHDPDIYLETYHLLGNFDKETIETIQVYIEHNCSPLLASYALYVHKNTVTYRINAFTKKTGISLEPFSNQMFLYELIELNKSNEDSMLSESEDAL